MVADTVYIRGLTINNTSRKVWEIDVQGLS
jgi:hypothetical protein